MSLYEYRATVLRVVDGDTVNARVDLGFDIRFDMKLRLFGINAPEMNTQAGKDARAHLLELLSDPAYPLSPPGTFLSTITVRTVKDRQEKYGRYLAILVLPGGSDVNVRMVADGHAVIYQP